MKKHLTDAAVQRTKPPKEGSLEIFDLGYPGLTYASGTVVPSRLRCSGGKAESCIARRWGAGHRSP